MNSATFGGSAAAEQTGSRNVIGIKDPAIDQLIDQVISAPDRESLITRTRALDRVLLWNHLVIPHWHLPYARIAYWKKFNYPGQSTHARRTVAQLVDRCRETNGPGTEKTFSQR